ncbi:aminotransferase class V-fold PLP-dependent enzyme [Deinococcus maricopensis]|uniref:cysteine desulfurase n=1 Tax=Deinococcus maricopensis (strain DSM 21211 / LMG 22137 / NRRL B-23946 / LB-34) TaxID=709986 RepID=E8U859_DEIML|nr:aminotransferase class V-fold PLP-dependent enzyme [Deinococcus maricopensis]ADV67248.1 Selenocysteine lyase [Deinococcus maricopensis DSM 21211]
MSDPRTLDFDVQRYREDFPMLRQTVHGRPLVYLDTAATAQKPQVMMDCLNAVYTTHFAKDAEQHTFSQGITDAVEAARATIARFVHAPEPDNIVLLQNATEGLAIVAEGLQRTHLRAGDEIVLTGLEHHSNIIPWLIAAEQTGAVLRVAPVSDAGEVHADDVAALLSDRTKVVAVSHVSHVLGTILPVREIAEVAHARGAVVVVDGAQATPHVPLDLQALGCDFYVMCGHKMYGPTSVGLLYGTREWLERLPAWEGGSDNAKTVTFGGWTPKAPPKKFEAGTQALADIIALGQSVEYLSGIGMDRILWYEQTLAQDMIRRLRDVPGVRVLGDPQERVGLASFVIDGVDDPKTVEQFLDQEYGVAVRGGDLTAQPLMERFGVPGAVRASLGLYSTRAEIDTLIEGVEAFVRAHRA